MQWDWRNIPWWESLKPDQEGLRRIWITVCRGNYTWRYRDKIFSREENLLSEFLDYEGISSGTASAALWTCSEIMEPPRCYALLGRCAGSEIKIGSSLHGVLCFWKLNFWRNPKFGLQGTCAEHWWQWGRFLYETGPRLKEPPNCRVERYGASQKRKHVKILKLCRLQSGALPEITGPRCYSRHFLKKWKWSETEWISDKLKLVRERNHLEEKERLHQHNFCATNESVNVAGEKLQTIDGTQNAFSNHGAEHQKGSTWEVSWSCRSSVRWKNHCL